MNLRDVMVCKPIVVGPDDSLQHASQIMAWTDIHHLPVTVAGGLLVGLLSERDLLAYRAREPEHDPASTPVSLAMRRNLHTAEPESSVREAAERLSSTAIGCLPVTQDGQLIGLVTRTDILIAEARGLLQIPGTETSVADIMTHDPETVGPDEYVLDAAKKMSVMGVRHLPVVEGNGMLVGILSDRDIQLVALDPQSFATPKGDDELHLLVRDAMSKPPMYVRPTEDWGTVAALFVQFQASAIPVLADDGKLMGIISYIDLLRALSPRRGPSMPAHA